MFVETKEIRYNGHLENTNVNWHYAKIANQNEQNAVSSWLTNEEFSREPYQFIGGFLDACEKMGFN